VLRVALLGCVLPAVAFAQPGAAPAATPAAAAAARRSGITVEANAGFGWIRSSPTRAPSFTSGISLAIDVGVGVWLTPQLALTGRFAGVSNFADGERLGAYFVGPSVQYWLDHRWWLGGGAGLGVLASSTSDSDVGFAFDIRLGRVIATRDAHVYDVSLEITPARFSASGDSATLTGVALLFGFQYL
jgi:hypothetical protein